MRRRRQRRDAVEQLRAGDGRRHHGRSGGVVGAEVDGPDGRVGVAARPAAGGRRAACNGVAVGPDGADAEDAGAGEGGDYGGGDGGGLEGVDFVERAGGGGGEEEVAVGAERAVFELERRDVEE